MRKISGSYSSREKATPKWKIFICKIFKIPLEKSYLFSVALDVKGSHSCRLFKGDIIRDQGDNIWDVIVFEKDVMSKKEVVLLRSRKPLQSVWSLTRFVKNDLYFIELKPL